MAFLGNWKYSHTTECEYSDAFKRCGHDVVHFQEGNITEAKSLCDLVRHKTGGFDLVIWIRTPQLARDVGEGIQWRLITECDRAGIPLVAVHLDRWWGLEREPMIFEDPYFRVTMMLTADGGHDEQWADAGIRHRWLPPGISERWCKPGHFRKELACDVLFVGSWKRYHDKWEHRTEMVQELSRAYGERFHVAPHHGQPRVIGAELTDYYWSAKVVVGDSCLVPLDDGTPIERYCSDRVPETLGRGGILLHPFVEGLPFEFYSWNLGDFDDMRKQITRLLALSDVEREKQRHDAITRAKEAYTYTHRVGELVDILKEENLL